MKELSQTEKNTSHIPRPPVVVIMGHIDHGKSTLLDYIRKANTTEREAGGITQHVAAYEANGITFLDTPGHAAFAAIRERGSKTADIAILIVSAEDGVKPQTLEAIDWIKKNNIPFLVAINKIDKPNANIEKTKTALAEAEVLVEGWGGTIPCFPISAKTGEGVESLLETITLQAEVDDLSFDPNLPASGFIIESKQDGKRGISATLVLKEGSLKKGMFVRSGSATAPVRIVENFIGSPISEAHAGSPIILTGWSEVPPVGEAFYSYHSKIEVEKAALENKEAKVPEETVKDSGKKIVPIVIKGDTVGSVEAIIHEIRKVEKTSIGEKLQIKVISFGVGSITEADVTLAKAFPDMIIFSFNSKVEPSARDMALRNNTSLQAFSIIYELTDWLETEMKKRVPQEETDEISGKATVLKIFSVNKNKQVIGGRVEEGTIEANARVSIYRREAEIGEGNIRELQSKKTKTGRVEIGTEFGAMIESKTEIAMGDKIVCVKKIFK